MEGIWNSLIASALTVALAAGAALIPPVSKFIADVLLRKHQGAIDKSVDLYRMKLQKSAFLFEKEYQAALELSAIVARVLPSYSEPDMDWDMAGREIAESFGWHEKTLRRYLIRHGAILDEETTLLIKSAEAIAGQEKFSLQGENLIAKGQEFYETIEKANALLLARVRSQAAS